MVPKIERCIHAMTSGLFILLWITFFMCFSMVVSSGVVTTVAWIARGAVSVGAQPAFVSILNNLNLISDDHAVELKNNMAMFDQSVHLFQQGQNRLLVGLMIC